MNNLSSQHANCSLSSVELFQDRLRQESIIDHQMERINPINSLDGTQVIEFLVKGNDDFIDLHNSTIQLKIKIVNNDNTNLAAAAEVACVNYPIATLFEHVDVYLNNDLVSNTSNYGYKAYLESLLTYSDDAKKGWLQAGAFFKDTHAQMDTKGDANAGFRFRRGLLAESKVMELVGGIHSGLFKQERLMLNHVDVKLVFTRYADAFCLMTTAANNVKIEIIDAWLMIKRNTLASHKVNEVEKTLQKHDAKYFIPRIDVKSFTYAQGPRNVSIRNASTGRDIPQRIVIGLVSNAAFNGSKTLNPFDFKHYNMSSVDITIDSKSVYGKPLAIDVANGQYMEAYWTLMNSLGFTFRDDGCRLTRNEYDNGFFLICADLSPTQCNGQYDDPIQSGNLEIDIRFSEALPETINAIVYMEYANTISINSARRAVKDFA